MSVALIGYTAFAMSVAGALLLAHTNVWGWVLRLFCNVLWITYALQIEGGGPMWLNHAVFIFVNLYGLKQWRIKE